MRAHGPAPCLAARNTASGLWETVAITDALVLRWSWGEPLGDASAVVSAAQAIAYVLSARDAQLDQ